MLDLSVAPPMLEFSVSSSRDFCVDSRSKGKAGATEAPARAGWFSGEVAILPGMTGRIRAGTG